MTGDREIIRMGPKDKVTRYCPGMLFCCVWTVVEMEGEVELLRNVSSGQDGKSDLSQSRKPPERNRLGLTLMMQ